MSLTESVVGKSNQTGVICPRCKNHMDYIKDDNFYRCPECLWTLWTNERNVCCPSCHLPMRWHQELGYYYCSTCKLELWAPEEEENDSGEGKIDEGLEIWSHTQPEEGEQLEDDPSTWRCYGRVYGPPNPVKFSASKSGRRNGKTKIVVKGVSQRYLLD